MVPYTRILDTRVESMTGMGFFFVILPIEIKHVIKWLSGDCLPVVGFLLVSFIK